MYVGGSWIESESGKRMEATSPATGETIGSVPEATRDDAGRAIAAANAAAREWAARSVFERALKLAQCVVDAELPAGGFNLVTGPGAVVGDEIAVNAGTNYWESHLPFGGRAGSQSGIGRVGGRFSMETFTELKTVVNLG